MTLVLSRLGTLATVLCLLVCLLAALVRRAGRVVTHRQLLQDVWGANYVGPTHYLRVSMAQLRHKLERDPTRPRLLGTEAGVGYRRREGADSQPISE